jgi:hypothetical protein
MLSILYLLLVEIGAGQRVPRPQSRLQYEMETVDAVPGPSQAMSANVQDPTNRSSGRQSFCHDFKTGKIPVRLRCVLYAQDILPVQTYLVDVVRLSNHVLDCKNSVLSSRS